MKALLLFLIVITGLGSALPDMVRVMVRHGNCTVYALVDDSSVYYPDCRKP